MSRREGRIEKQSFIIVKKGITNNAGIKGRERFAAVALHKKRAKPIPHGRAKEKPVLLSGRLRRES